MSINDTQAYYSLLTPKYISWDFYSQYVDKQPPFGELGTIVFLRTYSRFIDELGRREYWREVVLRVVEYSLNLDEVTFLGDKQKEAEQLFDTMFNLRGFPAGRTLWIGNTKITEVNGTANFNCSAATTDSISKFAECFYMLMVGTGYGFSVEKQWIDNLPMFYPGVKLQNVKYEYNKYIKQENTNIEFYYVDDSGRKKFITDSEYEEEDLRIASDINYLLVPKKATIAEIIVGDSRVGWVNTLRLVLTLMTNPSIEAVEINYDYVRPEGYILKTFGGRASGHGALQSLIQRVSDIVNELKEPGQLSSVQCLDILNSIGIAVVVGGVRRSSQLALGDLEDSGFITAKKNLWNDESLTDKRATRVMSNNSVTLYENPGLQYFKELMESVRTSGEPGIYSIGNAQKKHQSRKLTNPCGEILLDDRGVCNLTEANVVAHVNTDGTFNWDKWVETIRLITRMGSRITLVTMWHPEWDKMQKRDRLLGVSMTGIVEAFDMLNWNQEQIELFFATTQSIVDKEADIYHDSLGIERSLLKTTIKPSGSLSQLPTVSSGIHRPYAPYYLRRIRVSRQDPLAMVLYDLGLRPVPENSQGDDLFAEQCNTWVFTFPIKTSAKINSIDEPALVQLERYKTVMKYYVQHNCSITISVAENEWDDVAVWLYENYDDIIGISFLPRFNPLDDDGKVLYPNLPYQTSNPEEYAALKVETPMPTELQLIELLQKYEQRYEEADLGSDCASGACPVR
ncbi:ribonucleoside-triphosphate reductase, adenosylcobalamin-dependent [Scytonema sp. NUACC26]|uniref:ribonucleoside-triphosphate reductase, adenosylcobalamin-dependent n=1 Tax=Scytonema sp. NUACC26 TaxID=3140176 RepID=UPI0034DC5662